MAEGQNHFDGEILEKVEEGLKEPRMYRVLLLNDDYTSQDFVVEILVTVFHKQAVDATRIMLDVHKKGRGIVGLYPYDLALTKVKQVKDMSLQREFPLKCVMEKT
ncbi:MAG: ATP-dependent Clp protease adapter ClpS [Spirochaetaceae bacterium 4572_59]|nr:MAG: ATP-dependent Clp protease adapter ClpS [Spirochaetaceae bacterium 4572_59]